jgi:Tfp pilus assembly protein PilV
VIGGSLGKAGFDEGGLTLVEVVLATGILAVGLAGLMVVIPVGTHGVHAGHQTSTATFLAEQMVERARAASWTTDPEVDCLGLSAADTPPVPTGATCRGETATRFPDEDRGVDEYPGFRRSVRITSCATTPCVNASVTGMRLVQVTVTYTPLTTMGVATSPRAVSLTWLASQK